jgi:uncharacterized protein YjbI with pentapeptide repeats
MWLTAVVLPLMLLLWTQIRFLPYHSVGATWLHRLAVVIDALLIFFLWPQLSPGRRPVQHEGWRLQLWRLLSVTNLVGLVCGLSILLCLVVLTIPGEEPESGLWFGRRNLDLQEKVLTNPLPAEVINTLRDGGVDERERELGKVSPLNFLQGRDLRFGNFYNAVLPKLDLRSRREGTGLILTELSGADLRWAQMQGVLLDEAMLRNTALQWAQMQGSSLWSATLDGANLSSARLQAARLGNASLVGTIAQGAQLQGADLTGAKLGGADLSGAQLQGANLQKSDLGRTNLRGASLQGANLTEAKLEGADVEGADSAAPAAARLSMARASASANLELAELPAAKAARRRRSGSRGTLPRGARLRRSLRRSGLALQALSSPQGDRPGLAAALLEAEDRSECQGVKRLPAAMREALERSPTESVPLPEWEDPNHG